MIVSALRYRTFNERQVSFRVTRVPYNAATISWVIQSAAFLLRGGWRVCGRSGGGVGCC